MNREHTNFRYTVRPSATKGALTLYEVFDSAEGRIVKNRLNGLTARGMADSLNGSREVQQARRLQALRRAKR